MVDLIENWSQTFVLLGCMIYGLYLSLKEKNIRYIYITCAMTCCFLGDLTYSLYIWVTGDYPYGFSAADLSYIGSYLFFTAVDLYAKEQWTAEQKTAARQSRRWAWAAVGFTLAVNTAMLIELALYGCEIANSLIYLIPICVFAYEEVTAYFGEERRCRPYHRAVLLFLFFELMMFLFSSFGIDLPYRIFDYGWTILFPFLLPLAVKGEKS